MVERDLIMRALILDRANRGDEPRVIAPRRSSCDAA